MILVPYVDDLPMQSRAPMPLVFDVPQLQRHVGGRRRGMNVIYETHRVCTLKSAKFVQ